MKTVRRMLYRDIVSSVAFVALAFLSLSFFIDFVDELQKIGRPGFTLWFAVGGAMLELPGNLYELLPIAVLIGTIYSMARLAQTSEFTILRTGGLSPSRALRLLALLGLVFSALTFAIGEYVVPFTEKQTALLKVAQAGGRKLGATGAWLKERRVTDQGERHYSVNVAGIDGRATLVGIRIFEFDADGRHLSRIVARQARVGAESVWKLTDAEVTTWPAGGDPTQDRVQRQATLAQHAERERGLGSRAAAEDDVCRRTVALQRTPQRARAGVAAPPDPVLEKGAVPAGLPGADRAVPTLCVPACALGRHQSQGLWRHHAGDQLRAAQQRGRPHRHAARLDTVARGCHA
jgi:lipopolysaccharide export LptBFGC system permease protein LptF